MAARSKAWICGRPPTEIVGSNPTGDMNAYCCECCVLSGTGGADKSLARPTSRRILFDSENISFDASLVIYINCTNIPPIMIINRLYENQNLLSL